MRPTTHEIYGRRRSRNVGLGLTLGGFVALVFLVTIVKLDAGHTVRGMQLAAPGTEAPVLAAPAGTADHIPTAAERRAARAAEGN